MRGNIHIIGGGTFFHVRPHLSLCAPAYGKLAAQIADEIWASRYAQWHQIRLHLTKMADPASDLVTNADVERLVKKICASDETHIVFMTAAMCDFEGFIISSHEKLVRSPTPSGKDQPRLRTWEGGQEMVLLPAKKVLHQIRSKRAENPRKDIFLVACKTTAGATENEMFLAGLRLLKEASCNLVLVNDVHTRLNMIVTPEQARYAVTEDRDAVVRELVNMTHLRSSNTFERTEVVEGLTVLLHSEHTPQTFRDVVAGCIDRGAYKDLLQVGKTVGHYAWRVFPEEGVKLFSSCRHQDFNKEPGSNLVFVEVQDTSIKAHGVKPSAGVRSQAQLFQDHPDYDCVVHFHCPPKEEARGDLSIRPQYAYECGSHECGKNTSSGIKTVHLEGDIEIGVVYLDHHGPNILFKSTDPAEPILRYLDRTFNFMGHTGDSSTRDLKDLDPDLPTGDLSSLINISIQARKGYWLDVENADFETERARTLARALLGRNPVLSPQDIILLKKIRRMG